MTITMGACAVNQLVNSPITNYHIWLRSAKNCQDEIKLLMNNKRRTVYSATIKAYIISSKNDAI